MFGWSKILVKRNCRISGWNMIKLFLNTCIFVIFFLKIITFGEWKHQVWWRKLNLYFLFDFVLLEIFCSTKQQKTDFAMTNFLFFHPFNNQIKPNLHLFLYNLHIITILRSFHLPKWFCLLCWLYMFDLSFAKTACKFGMRYVIIICFCITIFAMKTILKNNPNLLPREMVFLFWFFHR